MLWSELLAISFTVLSANLQHTEAPKIRRQKLIVASGNLYEAISVICNNPLANNVPDISGTLFASGLLQITDIASYKLPDATINFCLLILGASVCCRFADKTVKEIANNSLHSIVATTIL